MLKELRCAVLVFLVLTVLTGVAYPLLITVIAQAAFPHQANGSLISRGDQLSGSELIGQSFSDPRYFWSRPSATSAFPNDASSSSGSNFGPTNPDQMKAVTGRIEALKKAGGSQDGEIPVELVTASASGLDPHISPAAAEYQLARVAKARGLSAETVRGIVAQHTQGRTFGLLGEPRVNVLAVNLELDNLQK